MNKTYKNQITVLFLSSVFSAYSQADLIGYDLNSAVLPSLDRFVGHNNYSEDIFPSSNDGSQIYRFTPETFDEIPEGLVDASGLGRLDNIGLRMPSSDFTFFGVVDTVNATNPSDYVEARWDFEIDSITDVSVAMDFAAMGDFESSDEYQLNFAIDYGTFFPLFEFRSQTQLTQSYLMESGDLKEIADPMSVSVRNSNVYHSLDNMFTSYTSVIEDTGSNLTIQLLAKADGGTEAFGFSNMRVFGELPLIEEVDDLPSLETPSEPSLPAPEIELVDESDDEVAPILLLPISSQTDSPLVSEVPEPNSLMLMALPLLGLMSRFKAKVLV